MPSYLAQNNHLGSFGRNSKPQPKKENRSPSKPTKISQAWDSDGGSAIINVDDLGFSVVPLSTQPVDKSPIRDAMSAKKLRVNLGLTTKAKTSVKISIREKIKSCLVHNQHHCGVKDGRFLPINELRIILSDASIKALLREEYPHETDRYVAKKLDAYISRRRILGILIYMYPEHLRLFEDFVNANITDEDLPLTPDSTDESTFRTRRGRENTTMLKEWEDNDITLFYSYQPIFLAPFFDIQEDRLCNYSLDEAIPLPWLNYEFKTRGGNAVVHRVEIHPSHHNFKSYQPSDRPLSFALKEIPNIDVDIYKQELSALEKPFVQMQKEKHLIKLLLTFQHGQKYYFLFEWADGHLWDYWHKHPKGPEDAKVNSIWLADQCLGLATAVKRIHGLATWQKQLRREKSEVMNKNEREWGRHGDIKPHNILWFSSYRSEGAFLVLSDLGLTRYHSSVTRSLVSPTSLDGCTDLYRPPEMDMPGHHVCSKYDIWSLGCVFLEFCTWWLRGSRSVHEFESLRVLDDGMVEEPKYFLIPTDEGAKPQVKPAVLKWIKDLRGDAKGDLFAERMLDLIKDGMLVVDKRLRYPADRVCTDILDIVAQLRKGTSPPKLLVSLGNSGSRSCDELYETRAGGNSKLRLLRQQKECEDKASRLSEENLHTEGCWDSRSSSCGLESAIGTSSNDDSADETPDSIRTPATTTFDDNLISKKGTELEIEEWRLNVV
ncbi:kinase-like domain-containing protein [Xylaria telfairii]|nr:kinase-like domain-containing protein [Xylaria telfairii]